MNDYKIDLIAVSSGYDRQTCWTQARAGAIPPTAEGQDPTVVLTMQKLRLTGSDDYEGLQSLYSTDRGKTWSPPVEQPGFKRGVFLEDEDGPVERAVCDFWPKWHAASGKLLGTGHTAQFQKNKISKAHARVTPYAVYDAQNHTWGNWKELKMPEEDRFFRSGAGCTQRVDLENGEILLPVYYGGGEPYMLSSTVLRCGFDGENLEYIEHGDEMTCNVPRGFGEPSLAHFQGRYYLTLRNDQMGHITVGDDGLHFAEPIPWRFDDGELLGSYNTQQHWVTQPDALYLTYTRNGPNNELNNDHVFRNRAPILMAQVDPDKLCVIRETERVVIPNTGARLGNFGIAPVSENEVWVVETEWMQNTGESGQLMLEMLRERMPEEEVEELRQTPYMCGVIEQFGAKNRVWAARLLF